METQGIYGGPGHRASRRGFFAALAGMALVLGGWLRARAAGVKKVGFSLAKVDKLAKVGGSLVIKLKERDVLLIRDSATSIRALDAVCTHKQCIVAYDAKDGRIHCPCHGSLYATDGKVLNGPAPRALAVYEATLDGDHIVVSLPGD